MAETILQLEKISKKFDHTLIADDISLTVNRGEFFTFLGPSGSGKSTILRMVAGLERADKGSIFIEGTNVVDVQPWNRNLGMVFQQYAIFPHMTVAQNVAYGLKTRKYNKNQIKQKVVEMLQLVGLSGLQNKNATLLSGGEQQRVALARALAPQPSILLLDEPLSALDEKIRREMQSELKRIQRKTGTTFLYVTHDQEEALTMSDRIAVLNKGECVQCDSPELLYRMPRSRFVAQFFRGCNVIEVEIKATARQKVSLSFGGITIEVPEADAPPLKPGLAAVAIRAENLRLQVLNDEYPTSLEARLMEIVYRGTNIDYLLELEDGQKVVATATRRHTLKSQEKVKVSFNPESVIILED